MDQINVNQLWQHYVDTITNHYMDFEGRVSRAHFWYYVLVNVVVGIAVGIVAGITGLHILQTIYGLGLFLPSLGMAARRLHDVGKPTMWILILAIPFALELVLGLLAIASVLLAPLLLVFLALSTLIGLASLVAAVVIIYFCAQPGVAGPNEYGPVPPQWPATSAAA
ncbi:MAG TPA: DUF805 domain-containing protein [Rhizomicrobium sp.]|nr:DUF805 domain-containing protein [Rhizomicrobium sp.]